MDNDIAVTPYFKQLSGGNTHHCAIVAANEGDDLYCWKSPDFHIDAHKLLSTPQVTNPVAVYSGGSSNCVVDDIGVQCWSYF